MEHFQEFSVSSAGVSLNDSEIDLLEAGGLQIVSTLMSTPSTIQQLALQLGLSRRKVKFLVDKLMLRQIVSVYREVQINDRIETYYTATAENVALHLRVDAPHQARLRGAHIIISSLQQHALKLLNKGDPNLPVAMKLTQCQIPVSKIPKFIEKLDALVREFEMAEDKTCPDVFALALMLYPVLEGHDS